MSAAEAIVIRPEPPEQVTSESEQDRRLVRHMLAMTPMQRLETLRNWARLVGEPGGRARPR